jgi:hypothetical protein
MLLGGFEPIIELLVKEASRVLEQRSDSMIQQVQALTLGPLDHLIELLSKAIHEDGASSEDSSGERHAIAAKLVTLRKVLSDLEPVLEPAGSFQPPVPEEGH